MAMSFSRPDPSSPAAVSTATFATSRKGFDQGEVRDFLRMVAAELARLQEREKFLERELRVSQRGTTNANVVLDEEVVTRMLGEEAARILSTAREAGSTIKVRAEEHASRVLREATDEAQRLREEAEIEAARRRQDASADAEAELQMAKQQGRDMVNEARAYRERVLNELARRREMARQQIEQLVHGRDRLLQAFERARLAATDVMAEMTPLVEPNEYVNLTPTTGPVPLMVPADELRARRERTADAAEAASGAEPEQVAEPDEEPTVDEIVDDVVAETELDTDDEPEAADVVAEDEPLPAEVESAEVESAEVEIAEVESAEVESADGPDDDRAIAPVVSLFGGDNGSFVEPDRETDTADIDGGAALAKGSVDDLFAKLRAARTETVAEATLVAAADDVDDAAVPAPDLDETVAIDLVVADATEELSVFQSTPAAPATVVEYDDTAFGRRDAELTPLIVAGARKLKRVLADEQNDVLHALRSAKSAPTIDTLLPTADEHIHRYAAAIHTELLKAAQAGAASIGEGTAKEYTKAITKGHALAPAEAALGTAVVQPLRDRLERAVADADGDRDDLTGIIRAVYREWKTQRIDEHLDDVARMAFGHGALVALAPGTPICWTVDPNGPDCPDAEDNSLAGVVNAGDPFPTDHLCAPAHEGCRCMLQLAPR
jgi:DivIVA domain-containing protein